MNGKQLKNSILQWAIQGKLVPQDPNDEPASALLERIRAEKARLVKEGKIKKDKNESIIFRGDDNSHYEKFLATGVVKCIDDEIPFEIPESWCWVRLAQVLTVKGGKRIPLGDSFAPGPTSHIYIRVTEMKNHTLVTNNLKYISDSVYEKIKNYTIGKDDLYLTIAGTIGSVGIVPEVFDGMNLTENAVKLTNILIDKMFLVYGISSQFVQSQFSEKTKQMAQPKLAIERILTTLIPLPPINEQIFIVSRIEEIMPIADKYEKSQKALDKLNADAFDKLKKSVLQEAIQGKLVPQDPADEPASVLLERIREEKLRLLKEGKLKKKDITDSVIFKGDDNKYYEKTGKDIVDITENIPFDIPDSWSWCRLGTIFQHNTGKALNRADQKGKLLTYITTSNLYWDSFELDNLRQMCFTDDEIIKCTVQKGDLLVCEGGDIGRAAIWPFEEPVRIQNHIHRLRPYSAIATRFFYYTIAHFKGSGVIGGKGIGIQGLSSRALDKLLLPVPPMAEQYRIIEKLDKTLASTTR